MPRKRAAIICGSISVIVAVLFLDLFFSPELLFAAALTIASGMIGAFLGWYGERIGITTKINPLVRVIRSTVVFGIAFFIPGFIIVPVLVELAGSSASQGPLLGIFVTGPLGVLTGFIVGLVFVIYDFISKRTNLEK